MELLTKALEWPVSSLQGVAFLELLIIGVLIYVVITIKKNAKEAKEGRARIYNYVRAEIGKLSAEITEKTDKFIGMLRDHDEKCNQRYGEDQRWKGRMEMKVGLEEDSK